MTTIPKRVAALALSAALALGACGGGDNDPVTEPAPDPAAELVTDNVSGPVGAVSRANDVAGQLDQRNAELDSALP